MGQDEPFGVNWELFWSLDIIRDHGSALEAEKGHRRGMEAIRHSGPFRAISFEFEGVKDHCGLFRAHIV